MQQSTGMISQLDTDRQTDRFCYNVENQQIQQELIILRKMFAELSPKLCKLFNDQLDKLMLAVNTRNCVVRDHVNEQLDDIRLSIKSMEFDLEATKQEKEVLATKLKDAGLE